MDGVSQEDVKMRVGEGLKTFGAMKMMFNVRSCLKSGGTNGDLWNGNLEFEDG